MCQPVQTSGVVDEFQAWVASLGLADPSDPGDLVAGAMDFLREVFENRGPVTFEVVTEAAWERQVALARAAVELISRDLRATTDLPAPPFEHRAEPDSGVRVSYWGSYASTTVTAVRATEVTAEIADFMQDEIVEDLHTGWPMCPEHAVGAYAQVSDGQAVWFCRAHQHVVAPIGGLAHGARHVRALVTMRWSYRVGVGRAERYARDNKIECGLRVVEGEQAGLTSRWTHGLATLEPGAIVLTPYLGGVRFMRRAAIRVPVGQIDRGEQRSAAHAKRCRRCPACR